MSDLDRRLNAFRDDLADIRLEGRVDARRFTGGEPAEIAAAVASLHREPAAESGIDTQLIRGDVVTVFDRTGGWAWVQNLRDGYVGYCSEDKLAPVSGRLTHRVIVPRTFVYPDAELRHPPLDCLPMGARLCVVGQAETRGTTYHVLDNGEAVIARHLAPLDLVSGDYVATARLLLHTPYQWGGSTPFGIDCSGLVQLSMMMCGDAVLRDTDMQAASIGTPVEPGADYGNLQRGDLVFWKGHVGIMYDAETLLHASGHAMWVGLETLHDAVDRIAYLYGPPTICRRP
ncbi:MAG: C40 family peptidase [Brucellaceae bacterium]|nr:C40 family peptidase [Brucellaceae bacterium]